MGRVGIQAKTLYKKLLRKLTISSISTCLKTDFFLTYFKNIEMTKKQFLTKPFLKWAGGKFKIIDKILAELPKGQRLIEPFVGSGAVFLNAPYKQFLLADKIGRASCRERA